MTTLGKDGSICYVREDGKIRKEEIGICQVEQVVDATGSGDAYMAGFVYGYLHGYSPADCCRLEVYYLTLFYRQKGAVQMRQQNRNYYRNLKHYAERGNADEYIIYGEQAKKRLRNMYFFREIHGE